MEKRGIMRFIYSRIAWLVQRETKRKSSKEQVHTSDVENEKRQRQDVAQHLLRLLPYAEEKKRDPSRKSPQALHWGTDRTQLSFTSK